MINELKEMGATVCIVSCNDTDILKFVVNNKGFSVDRVVGDDTGIGRGGQLKGLVDDGFYPAMTVVYDDMRKNLVVAEALGFRAVAAPFGYDRPDNLAGFRQALPDDFPRVFAEMLGIGAGRRRAVHC